MSLRRFAIHTAYCLTMLLTLGSCTFDYFEDDMNYKVFVPEFKERTIRNCRVLVWDKKTGRLVGDRYARVGATNDNVPVRSMCLMPEFSHSAFRQPTIRPAC